MKHECLDTNVIVRFLIETPESIPPAFRGVFGFFKRIEDGALSVHLPELVLFQAFFVLTSYYSVPSSIAAEKLEQIVRLKGIAMPQKLIAQECLRIVIRKKIDIVDAWITAYSVAHGLSCTYSFDSDLAKLGLKLHAVE